MYMNRLTEVVLIDSTYHQLMPIGINYVNLVFTVNKPKNN